MPELGGHADVLDVMGVNYYPFNQWFVGGQTIAYEDPAYTDFKHILIRVYQRYHRPILVAETGAEGEHRAPWLRYVCDQVAQAMAAGVPVQGICLYPVTDYPGWANDRHCATGLLGFPDELGRRPVDQDTATELAAQQARFARPVAPAVTGYSTTPRERDLPRTWHNHCPRTTIMSKPDMTQPVDQTPPPEPSREDQGDIATRVQEGLAQSNKEGREHASPSPHKATEFDGSPNPESLEDNGMRHPQDDTPNILEKKDGTS
jgi:hypothetical protein